MTLRQLIDEAVMIGRQITTCEITTCEIPVIYNGKNDNITSLELTQDDNGNYYVKIQ